MENMTPTNDPNLPGQISNSPVESGASDATENKVTLDSVSDPAPTPTLAKERHFHSRTYWRGRNAASSSSTSGDPRSAIGRSRDTNIPSNDGLSRQGSQYGSGNREQVVPRDGNMTSYQERRFEVAHALDGLMNTLNRERPATSRGPMYQAGCYRYDVSIIRKLTQGAGAEVTIPTVWTPLIIGPNPSIAEEMISRNLVWNQNGLPVDCKSKGMLLDPRGYITVRIDDGTQIDITCDKGIRCQNNMAKTIMSLSGTGTSSALIHPSGCVYHIGSIVEGKITDPYADQKYVKMWHKGICFTSEKRGITYLVDEAGIRTTSEKFADLCGDISFAVLQGSECNIGPECIKRCYNMLERASCWRNDTGEKIWQVSNVRIKRALDGTLTISRLGSKCLLSNGFYAFATTMNTPLIHVDAYVCPQGPCLFVNHGERRISFSSNFGILTVRNGYKKAGFDRNNKIKIY